MNKIKAELNKQRGDRVLTRIVVVMALYFVVRIIISLIWNI